MMCSTDTYRRATPRVLSGCSFTVSGEGSKCKEFGQGAKPNSDHAGASSTFIAAD